MPSAEYRGPRDQAFTRGALEQHKLYGLTGIFPLYRWYGLE